MENENTDFQQTSQPTQGQMTLPNSTSVLVMGIISIATCWCYGIPGIVLGIISIVMGNKAKKLYADNSEQYSLSSFKNMKAGYICGIIGLCLSAFYLVFIIIYLIIIGAALSTAFSTMPWNSYNF
jgi:hypothetical protein